MGKIRGTVAVAHVVLVQGRHAFEMALERCAKTIGKYGHPVFLPLAIADGNLFVGEVDIFDAEAQGLDEPEAGAIEQVDNERVGAFQAAQYGLVSPRA